MPKKEGIKILFDDISPEYDRLNHVLSMNIDKGWRRKAVRWIVDTDRPLKVLDVACGTGDLSIAIASRALKMRSRGVRVTGIDISEGMMRVGRRKVRRAGFEPQSGKNVFVEMVQADCEELPYTDGSFDRITAGFGVRNFEHLDLGLREMARVLSDDGRLVILELSVPSNVIIRWIYKLYFMKILPGVGGKVSGNRGAYEYLPASVLRFPKPDKFIPMLKEAGFRKVIHKPLTFGICRMYVCEK